MKDISAFEDCQHILVVAAHTDDLETMCGGTLIQLLAQGKSADLLLATDGDLGTTDPAMNKPTLAALRRQEALDAAQMLGLGQVYFLGHHDGQLVNNLSLRREVAHVYRRSQADTILTFDPLAAYRTNLHPDHIALAKAAIDALIPSKMPLYHPEQLSGEVHLSRVKHCFCFLTLEPDIVISIDAVYEQKIAISIAHQSQFPEGEKNLTWMKRRDRAFAQTHASQEIEFAEGFRTITTY